MRTARRFGGLGIAIWIACGCVAFGQYAAPAAPRLSGRGVIRIREVTGWGRNGLVKTPQYQVSTPTGRVPPRDWAQIQVTFDGPVERDAWLDDVTIQFHVLLYSRFRPEGDQFSILNGTEQVSDVAASRLPHLSAMFVRPSGIERYGEVVGVAVEIAYKGETVDTRSEGRLPGNKALPMDWWKNANLKVRDGYLLKKADTPFAPLYWDDFEYAK